MATGSLVGFCWQLRLTVYKILEIKVKRSEKCKNIFEKQNLTRLRLEQSKGGHGDGSLIDGC